MILHSFKYIRQKGKSNEWRVVDRNKDFIRFDNINLLVGKNGTGKSRTLTALREIARLLALKKKANQMLFTSVEYQLILKENGTTYTYFISIEDHKIVEEVLSINGQEKYNRTNRTIYSNRSCKLEPLSLSDQDAITSLQGSIDYPYITELYQWSHALKEYAFTNSYAKNKLIKSEDELKLGKLPNECDSDSVICLLSKGKEKFAKQFLDSIITDMKHIGYDISHVGLEPTNAGIGISVKEEELNMATSQIEMSQGMYRALSFLIQLNYALFQKDSVCLLIDDLGEGLDFSRSKLLIDIMTHKIKDSEIQLFITTNDRYIMNKIPLRYWSVIERTAEGSIFYNYYNSKDVFEDFRYTGLNNFDFLATDFYLHGFGEE